MERRDIIFMTETHESPERGLPRVEGYQWESAHRQVMRQATSRGSGGIAVLFRNGLHDYVRVVARDPEARYMWLSLCLSETT